MAEKKKNKRLITPLARVSYAQVYKPKRFDDDTPPKYSCDLLFDEKTDLTSLRNAVFRAKVAQWGADKSKWPKKIHSPFKDGDEREDQPEYAGKTYITPTNKNKPYVVDMDRQPIAEEDDEFYSGCYVYACLTCKAYDMKVKKGVSFYLEGVMKKKDGDRFGGGGGNPDDDFEGITEGADDEDDDSEGDGGF